MLFNAYVTASAVSATMQTGLLHAVHDIGIVEIDDFSVRQQLSAQPIRAVADVLARGAILEVVEHDPFVVTSGPEFGDIWHNKGYFLWLVRGYGDMLARVGELSAKTGHERARKIRDGRAIAQAGKEYGDRFVDPIVNRIIEDLEFTVLADLGCGSANRIIRLAQRFPDKRFIGIEVDPGAVELAREAVDAAGLRDRITMIQDDVRRLGARPEYVEIDAIQSFFLGHELWPREACLATLAHVRRRMPCARNFLLCDTYRSPRPTPGRAPIFTLGFELTHAVMGQHVPTAQEWIALFEESAWSLRRRWELQIAFSEVFHLTPTNESEQ
jgi:SAM-dependent methyltransferase